MLYWRKLVSYLVALIFAFVLAERHTQLPEPPLRGLSIGPIMSPRPLERWYVRSEPIALTNDRGSDDSPESDPYEGLTPPAWLSFWLITLSASWNCFYPGLTLRILIMQCLMLAPLVLATMQFASDDAED